jgi:hypothetical protein
VPKRKVARKAVPKRKVARKAVPKGKAARKAVPKGKVAGKSASRKRPKKKSAPKRKRRQTPVAVGDAVRLPAETRNLISRYDPKLARGARGTEGIEGIVCSIRDIRTGKLVAKTRGDLTGFVLEILHTQTFGTQYSSERNTAGASGSGSPSDSPVSLRLRGLLQELASRRELVSASSGVLSQEPFAKLLDGWRVVKMKAEAVDPLG